MSARRLRHLNAPRELGKQSNRKHQAASRYHGHNLYGEHVARRLWGGIRAENRKKRRVTKGCPSRARRA